MISNRLQLLPHLQRLAPASLFFPQHPFLVTFFGDDLLLSTFHDSQPHIIILFHPGQH